MTKEKLYTKIIALIDERIELAHLAIASAKESRDNETKSSVGDKYETSRTLMQQEVEKNRIQLHKAERLKTELGNINLKQKSSTVEFGSLVSCTTNTYFISTALGKIVVDGESCYCISLASPIGKVLHNKRAGDKVSFMGKRIEIVAID
ncbi:GreA/GreB family elongation factor [Draconibacterium halophilum]|uniref:3-oxoacyl-ACP synthase n=1 Tax=Draconibacterium halophilum TaxID=2706887 RepID=A0A6C0RGE0_9BACT|nr:GreA/GreB family elongation factor [Draconibacterium halophilum]QIA08735.1 3-oxoacyl-ACP synthase [Draconibacterium halophilum]